MPKKIVLLDQSESTFQGLKPLFTSMSGSWELRLETDQEEALDTLAREPYDMLITTRANPKGDATNILQAAGQLYPEMIRLALPDLLDGPCSEHTLENVREIMCRAFDLKDLLGNAQLHQTIASIKQLPSLPALYTQIIRELNAPDASLKKIGEIISRDLAMTAKLLQLVNSAYFALPYRISSPAHAVSLLGMNTIKSLVLSTQIFEQFNRRIIAFDIDHLWQHSFIVGTFARNFAAMSYTDSTTSDDAFVAGLLHDLGKLILANSFPKEYHAVVARIGSTKCSFLEAERSILGTTHAEIGAYLLGLWGFGAPVVEAVAFHHQPGTCIHTNTAPLLLVHAANAIANQPEPVASVHELVHIEPTLLTHATSLARLDSWLGKSQLLIAAQANKSRPLN